MAFRQRFGYDTTKTTEHVMTGPVPYAVTTAQGGRKAQEDRYTVQLELPGSNHETNSLLAIYDGHRGSRMAQYASETLHRTLIESEHYKEGRYSEAFVEAFIRMDEDVRAGKVLALEPEKVDNSSGNPIGEKTISGCTATVALYTGERIWVANAGDSRAILCRRGHAHPLSRDHNPFAPIERERIKAAGSAVIWGRVSFALSMSRTLGDIDLKYEEGLPPERHAITCVPDVVDTVVTEEDEFLVLFSDGVWNAFYHREQLYRDTLKKILAREPPREGVLPLISAPTVDELDRYSLFMDVVHAPHEKALEIYLAAEELTNQNICDAIRFCVAQQLPLDKICECILDFCSQNAGSSDNATIIIAPMLKGRTLEQWYSWVAQRVQEGEGRRTPSTFPPYDPRSADSVSLEAIVANVQQGAKLY